MTVTVADIHRVARLACLAIEEKDVNKYVDNLNNVLTLAAQMTAVDTTDITPMAHPSEQTQLMRADHPTAITTDEYNALQINAPLMEQGLYFVPKVID